MYWQTGALPYQPPGNPVRRYPYTVAVPVPLCTVLYHCWDAGIVRDEEKCCFRIPGIVGELEDGGCCCWLRVGLFLRDTWLRGTFPTRYLGYHRDSTNSLPVQKSGKKQFPDRPSRSRGILKFLIHNTQTGKTI